MDLLKENMMRMTGGLLKYHYLLQESNSSKQKAEIFEMLKNKINTK